MILALSAAVGRAEPPVPQRDIDSLRAAVADLKSTFGPRYPKGDEYLARLDALAQATKRGDSSATGRFAKLKQEALLANPLLADLSLLVVKRKPRVKGRGWKPPSGLEIALPSNHECNASLDRLGYDNEIAVLQPIRPDGRLRTLYRPAHKGYVGEVDLHWDGKRMLFAQSDWENWKIWEMCVDGSDLRQVSRMPADVDSFDPCYLPDGRIVFACTAPFQAVPCWHGLKRVCNLYLMNADGSAVRQICFDQDHDLHPTVLPNGQVLYSRWDYTGINHIFLRELMLMNPDGTGQRAIYGSNSWYPNSLYFPRALPGTANRLVSILSGYHGVHRMGQLVLLDTGRGWHEAKGIVQRISGRGDPVRPMIRDNLVDDDWPKFLHPYPLSDKYFLVAGWMDPQSPWGIYLADVFDNLLLVREEPCWALLEPLPIRKTLRPCTVPDRVDRARRDAVVYLHDVYSGPGLAGVPRGTIRSLRVLAYHFGYPGLAGPDVIGRGGPWEVMRILGTVPLERDGSAAFRVPANTPVAFQALDAEGKAVQLMRSWVTAMPGETVSCLGCHETPRDSGAVRLASAAVRPPRELTPWRGPARGFDFLREVQPVLDKYCVGCHGGPAKPVPDLRAPSQVPEYRGQALSGLALKRLYPEILADTGGYLRYAPAYDALVPYLRRVGVEDDVSMLTPGEYHADTSPLVQLLRKGHQGVALDAEAWDRLVTWIDLNAPCHGTWTEVHAIPGGADRRRMAMRRQYGGPVEDPEAIPQIEPMRSAPVQPAPLPKTTPVAARDWPLAAGEAARRQRNVGPWESTVDLGDGMVMRLVQIPAGEFVMGDPQGEPDQWPPSRVRIEKPFWIGAFEVTNGQFRRFDPTHDSRYYQKRHAPVDPKAPQWWLGPDGRGLTLNDDQQPVLRVSWIQAMAFCRWLSQKTGMHFSLPTESQWEYACRAGSASALWYGDTEADFSPFANLADRRLAGVKQLTGGLEHLVREGAALSDLRSDDGAVVTARVGHYQPNPWGLYDMHGNAAEWTLSTYRPYPYREDDGRNASMETARKVVRGGSFFDPPRRAGAGIRLDYPPWQRVFNVGFRVVALQAGEVAVQKR
jgi:formylglycine-generating enzyme required for sulfatase activity